MTTGYEPPTNSTPSYPPPNYGTPGYPIPPFPQLPPTPPKSNAGKVLGAVGGLLALIVVVGFIVNNSSNDTSTTAASSADSSSTQDSTDVRFVTFLRDKDNWFDTMSASKMVETAHDVCSYLDSGHSTREAGELAMESGFTPTRAGYFVGATVGAYCPEYADN